MWHKHGALWVPDRKLYYGCPVPGVVASQGAAAVEPTLPTLGSLQTAINSSDSLVTQNGTASIVSGTRYLVVAMFRRSGSGTMALSATVNGDAVTPIGHTDPVNFDVGVWLGEITADETNGSAAVTFTSSVTGVATNFCVMALIPLNDAGAVGTPVLGPSTNASGTAYAENFTTVENNSLALIAIVTLDGNTPAITPDATVPTIEILDVSTGSGNPTDGRCFIGYWAKETAGASPLGGSWGTTEDYSHAAIEIEAAA